MVIQPGGETIAPGANWAGNYTYRARRLLRPESLGELQELVASSERIRVIGSRHSFNDLADTTGDLVDISRLLAEVSIDPDTRTARVSGGMSYGAVSAELERQGWALHNLASLPHISVAGAIATATHGSGIRIGNLATAVRALDIISRDGTLRHLSSSDPNFEGSVVSLGALGVVVRVWLAIERSYSVRQRAWDDIPFETILDNLSTVFAAGYSVSLFTDWAGTHIQQLWVKSVATEPPLPDELFGGTAVTAHRHPVRGMSAENCTLQRGESGRWLDRLPHFRMEFTPSSGNEIQSEYIVPMENAPGAIHALRRMGTDIAAVVQVSEIRAVAADQLWLSSSYGADALAFHFTWHPEPDRVAALVPRLEAALMPFQARPHWGKVHEVSSSRLRELYPRYDDFVGLVRRTDPTGKFRNEAIGRLFPELL